MELINTHPQSHSFHHFFPDSLTWPVQCQFQRTQMWGLILSSHTCFPVVISPSLISSHSQVLMRPQASRWNSGPFVSTEMHLGSASGLWSTCTLCNLGWSLRKFTGLWASLGTLAGVIANLTCQFDEYVCGGTCLFILAEMRRPTHNGSLVMFKKKKVRWGGELVISAFSLWVWWDQLLQTLVTLTFPP